MNTEKTLQTAVLFPLLPHPPLHLYPFLLLSFFPILLLYLSLLNREPIPQTLKNIPTYNQRGLCQF